MLGPRATLLFDGQSLCLELFAIELFPMCALAIEIFGIKLAELKSAVVEIFFQIVEDLVDVGPHGPLRFVVVHAMPLGVG
jgi:hypothetical protein